MKKEDKKKREEPEKKERETDLKDDGIDRQVSELEEKIGELNNELYEFKEKYLRLAAEFDNYRKRVEREKADLLKFGTEGLLVQLIPFDDIFESVVGQIENTSSLEVVHKGLAMLKKEFTKLLENLGVKKIKTVGERFNPELHEAAGVVETSDYEEGVIVEEDISGYMFHDRIIRPAVVKVAKSSASGPEEDEDSVSCQD